MSSFPPAAPRVATSRAVHSPLGAGQPSHGPCSTAAATPLSKLNSPLSVGAAVPFQDHAHFSTCLPFFHACTSVPLLASTFFHTTTTAPILHCLPATPFPCELASRRECACLSQSEPS